ncbi:replication protein RepA [Salmonella enterica]|nr:replication protein RepA [Salmonella enterica]EDT7837893.1 replication protein RepA [Salmonella enterica]
MRKFIGVFAFLVPGRHLIRTSSLPPYGVASHQNSLDDQQSNTHRRDDQESYSFTFLSQALLAISRSISNSII